MAVNAASSSYVNNASSNKGFSGLASGVDTESMVEQLLSGTQTKIDKQEGLKQQLEWKQEIYRDIISQINNFQNKFFSYSSDSNLNSAAFWNAMNAMSTSDAFKATATSSAATGSSSMEVRRLATKASVTSAGAVSGSLTGKLDRAALEELIKTQQGTEEDYTVKFKVGDKTVTANLKDLFVGADGSFTSDSTPELDRKIQDRLQDAFKDTGVTVTVKDGALKLVTEGDNRPTISVAGDSGALGLQRLGLTAGASSVSKTGAKTSTLSGKVDAAPKLEFTVTLDDLKKTVSVNLRDVMEGGSLTGDNAKIASAIQAGLNKAHGAGQVKLTGDVGAGFSLEVSSGRKVDIGGSDKVMAALGMKNGASNRIGLGTTLGELNLSTPLQGGSFRFTINGQEFHFTEDTAIIDVMDVINRSDAGVRMVYRAQDDKFVLEAKESGAGKEISMTQSEGNLINALLGGGVASGSRVLSKKLTYEAPGTAGKITDDTKADATLKDLGITGLTDKNGDAISEDTKLSELNAVSGGKYTITDNKIMQEATGDTTLADLGIKLYDKNGSEIAGTTTLAGLKDVANTLYDYEDGRIVANGKFTPGAPAIKESLKEVFGAEALTIGEDIGDAFQYADGQNAVVKVDGVITERSSNNFTINGINYDVGDLTGSYAMADDAAKTALDAAGVTLQPGQYIENGRLYNADGSQTDTNVYQDDAGNLLTGLMVDGNGNLQQFTGTTAKVTVTQDTDKIMDGIKEFIDEYNKLVKNLNDLLDEDTTYRDYAPLTDDQKKEMSEREIELWEEKSKGGLLHRDNTIQTFLQQMRTALYQKPAGASYALYELGIETGTWESKGQLTFGTDGEAKLRQLLENDPTGVASLFTDPAEGLGATLNNILNETARTSSGSPGTLVQLAGVKGMASDKDNSIYDQLKAIDDKIAALKKTYEAEKTRYWNQFNTMEQLISNMNTQSSYLAQMMGG